MQHMKEKEEWLGRKRYLSVAFDERGLGAESIMSVVVDSAEEGAEASFLPQVAQISAFGHF